MKQFYEHSWGRLSPFFFLLVLLFTSCESARNEDYVHDYDLIVKDVPTNLEKINSIRDDYNSTLPYPAASHGIYFSTNRNSSGQNFDIVYQDLTISYHQRDDALDINYNENTFYSTYTNKLLLSINSPLDELGPYYYFGPGEHVYFFYSNDVDGNQEIMYASSKKSDFGTANAQEIINPALPFSSINSSSDDMYPSIYNNHSKLIFCSNRGSEVFNIYEASFHEEEIDPDMQSSGSPKGIYLNEEVSSDGNDKCPFVINNMLIFASDREGGFGGFDLYYSFNVNGEWSAPRNMGEKINSDSNDYRPIMIPFDGFEENILLFSSDRPGGKGGFDLYIVRIANFPT